MASFEVLRVVSSFHLGMYFFEGHHPSLSMTTPALPLSIHSKLISGIMTFSQQMVGVEYKEFKEKGNYVHREF